ncbi:MAG: ligase-associated DNA damage response endonuclease PdeM [Halieaceae bacterium]|jgi:DNA ligase-associated metallophosphoesterase|nr:ligase-associated DNA damage response endonuclease PdeM [Halieaceae bacterium]
MSPLTLQGETLLLDARRALVWPAQSAVLVADTHFGKSAVFRREGLALPEGSDRDDMARLAAVLSEYAATRLFILGDFVHGALPRGHHFYAAFNQWRGCLNAEVHVVLGNHDRHLHTGELADVHWHDRLHLAPFELVHAPPESSPHYYLCGHVHPVVKLATRADALRMPVFWQRDNGLVLPAFGSLTGGYVVDSRAGGQCYGVGPDAVVPLPGRVRRV